MKIKGTIIIIAGIAITFFAGLLTGLTLNNTGMSLGNAVGTIGRVDQYRNINITEADIELRNEFLANDSMKEAYLQYLTMHYTLNIQLIQNLSYAFDAAVTAPGFRESSSVKLSQLEDYTLFLDNARINILEAIATITNLPENNKVAIRTVINSAGNSISQTITRSNTVLNYLSEIDNFFTTESKDKYPELVISHDRLFSNLMSINLINYNKPALKYLAEKGVLDKDSELAQLDIEKVITLSANDSERLKTFLFYDQEVLQQMLRNNEQFRSVYAFDKTQLQNVLNEIQTIGVDAFKGSLLFDSEVLRSL